MIIWLASYPKSGNTLLRSMLSAYLFSNDGIFNFSLLKNIKQYPDKGILKQIGVNINNQNEIISNSIRAQNFFNNKETVGFIKTHNMLYNFQKKNSFTNFDISLGVIYIVRDPRNMVISYAHHLNISKEEAIKFITKGKGHSINFMGNWSENYLSWKAFKANNKYLLVKYEDLIEKKEEIFLKILNFIFKLRKINLSINKDKLNNVLKTTTFEYLKSLEISSDFKESSIDKNGNKIRFFDKGAKRNWSKSLDPNMRLEIEKNFQKEMTELGYL